MKCLISKTLTQTKKKKKNERKSAFFKKKKIVKIYETNLLNLKARYKTIYHSPRFLNVHVKCYLIISLKAILPHEQTPKTIHVIKATTIIASKRITLYITITMKQSQRLS